MRMELADPTRGFGVQKGERPESVACIRNVEKDEILSCTGQGCYFYAAYTEDGVVYIAGVPMEHWDTTRVFKSKDLFKEYYTSGPWLRYSNGYYCMIVMVMLPCARYTRHIDCSQDLKTWQAGLAIHCL